MPATIARPAVETPDPRECKYAAVWNAVAEKFGWKVKRLAPGPCSACHPPAGT